MEDQMIEIERVDLAPIKPGETFPEMILEVSELLPVIGEDHLAIGFAPRSFLFTSRVTPARGHGPNLPTQAISHHVLNDSDSTRRDPADKSEADDRCRVRNRSGSRSLSGCAVGLRAPTPVTRVFG